MYTKNILNQDDILSIVGYLEQQIEKIDNYPDKWLFFQDPTIYGAWLFLINTLQDNRFSNDPEEIIEWKQDTENYVLYLLTLRKLCIKYKELCRTYFDMLHNLLIEYGEWLEGDNISASEIEEMVDAFGETLKDFGNIREGLLQMNNNSHKARFAVHSALCDSQDFLLALMNMGGELVKKRQPSLVLFSEAINNALRVYTKQFGRDILLEIKEDLNRNYKKSLIEPTNPLHWSDMLKAYDEGLKLAMNKELSKCKIDKQEQWDRHQPKDFLDENSELIDRIYELCKTEELIVLNKSENVQSFLNLLNEKNIELFYDIIVRRNLIQCEMFPELKAQHEAWLNNVKDQLEESDETGLDSARQSKLDDIIGILKKGNWKQPATSDNIELLLNTVFGKDTSLLDDDDIEKCELMWDLVEKGKGKDRKVIVSAKLAGFMGREMNLMKSDGPKTISDDLFGKNNNQVNAINKGKLGCSNDFDAVIPFLKKYINKIIRQV